MELGNAGQHGAFLIAQGQTEFQQLFALFHPLALDHAGHPQLHPFKVVERNAALGNFLLLLFFLFGLLFLLFLLGFGLFFLLVPAAESFQLLLHVDAGEQGFALADLDAVGQHSEAGQGFPGFEGFVGQAQLLKDPGGGGGHDGLNEHSHKAHAFRQGQQHVAQQALLFGVLTQHPGLGQVDVFIAFADDLPDFGQGLGELQLVHLFCHGLRQRGAVGAQLVPHGLVGCFVPSGDYAAKVLFDHRHRAADQVAQVIGQVGVHAGEEGFVGVVAVRAEGHFAHEVIAQGVHAVAGHDGLGIDHVALGFAHAVRAEEQPAVAEHLLGQGQPQGVEHDGPVDGVEAHDFLAHQMHVGGPVFLEQLVVIGAVAQGGDVIGQGVDPHIHGMLGVEVHGHAPLHAGAADAQILQAGLEEIVDHFIGALGGLDKLGMGFDVVDHPVLILAHTEEIAFLLHGLAGAAAVRTHLLAILVHQLGGGPEGFAGGAVHAFVFGLVNVALLVELAEDFLDDPGVAVFRGADEIVVVDVHQLPQLLGFGHDLVHVLDGGHARFGGLLLDLLAVLVGAGEEVGVIPLHLLEPGHGVGGHGGVGVADGHVAGGVVDGRGDVVGLFLIHGNHSF